MNGCDLLRKFKEDGIYIPVIVVTAFDEPQSREACKQYEVIEFLRKPVDSEALLDIINYIQTVPGYLNSKEIENQKC
jgi:CheY-like chemotaxis protein